MKQNIVKVRFAVLLACAALFGSCSSDDNTAEQILKDKIIGTWSISPGGNITKDEVDVTASYGELTLTFHADNTYTASHGDPMFASSGHWRAADSAYSSLVLDDLSVSVLALTNDVLDLSFFFPEENTGGRVKGISGEYTIHFTAQ